ncbi:MAG TPA: hypothetical protein VGE30_00530 [Candidatus Saccharimonadales bacterium]
MSAKRVHLLLWVALGVLLISLFIATYSVNNMLSSKSTQLASSKAEAEQLRNQQTGLVKSKQDVERYADLEKITNAIVPQDKDQARAVREITNIAANNRIQLTTVSFPSSTLGAQAIGNRANLSQLTPVKNIAGVYNLQITVGNNANNTVSFSQLDGFLRDLENNRRTAAVSSLSIQPQANSANRLVFTLIINTYIKPS